MFSNLPTFKKIVKRKALGNKVVAKTTLLSKRPSMKASTKPPKFDSIDGAWRLANHRVPADTSHGFVSLALMRRRKIPLFGLAETMMYVVLVVLAIACVCTAIVVQQS